MKTLSLHSGEWVGVIAPWGSGSNAEADTYRAVFLRRGRESSRMVLELSSPEPTDEEIMVAGVHPTFRGVESDAGVYWTLEPVGMREVQTGDGPVFSVVLRSDSGAEVREEIPVPLGHLTDEVLLDLIGGRASST